MWTLRSEDRLHEWKVFRNSLAALPFEEAIEKTTHLWSFAPFVNYHLSPAEITKWPDPWKLLTDNIYCDLSKTLGIIQTLYLSGHGKSHSYRLQIRQHNTTGHVYNLVLIDDGKYVLNYEFDTVLSNILIDETTTVLYDFSVDDLHLTTY
jgi:hypothetical protein